MKSETPGSALHAFARSYTAAWCSQNPASVAEHFSPTGFLAINGGPPATGRAAITEVARSFMTTFPNLQVLLDDLLIQGESAKYHWTLIGANTGPGGLGREVRISGHEEWTLGDDGLIAESLGHFDSEDYHRQLDSV